MTLATVTDINEYRARKGVTDGTLAEFFAGWSDERLQTRYTLLKNIEDGNDPYVFSGHPVVKVAFPNGFDPASHTEDSILAIRTEAVRRGVELI